MTNLERIQRVEDALKGRGYCATNIMQVAAGINTLYTIEILNPMNDQFVETFVVVTPDDDRMFLMSINSEIAL